MADLTNPIFTEESEARQYLESVRWPAGPFCPHCGEADNIHKMTGKAHRPGLFQCNSCRQQFSVTVGTVFERSKVPLHKWLLAAHLLSASKKGMSAHQLHRMLGVTYKTAWFMAHRIREAMREDDPEPMGGKGKTIEADETYFGGREKGVRGHGTKIRVVTLVERDGRARSFHVDSVTSKGVRHILVTNADRKSDLMTDEAHHYRRVGKEYARHGTVEHGADEYVKPSGIHTNTIEGYFSIFKRGMKGVYQHCGEQHLHRYLSEFDFRYTNRKVDDVSRRDEALKGIEGKRLTYRRAG